MHICVTTLCVADSPIIDWSTMLHKDVRSNDGTDFGIVDAVDGDYIGFQGLQGQLYKILEIRLTY